MVKEERTSKVSRKGTEPRYACLNDDNQVKKWGVVVVGDSAQWTKHLSHKHEEQRLGPNTHIKSGRCRDHP